jgi:hypothetical protein
MKLKMKKILLNTMLFATVLTATSSCTKDNTPINDPTTTPIKSFSGQMECVWNESISPNPKAFLDIDNGIVYDVNSAPQHAKDIDLIWSECSGGSIIQSPNEYYDAFAPSPSTSPNFQTAVLFANWSQRNQTLIDYSNSQTVANFVAVTDRPKLMSLIGNNFNSTSKEWDFMECTNADFAKIYYVQTTTGGVKKQGYIRFTSGQKGNNNFVKFEIKIEN